MPEVEFLQRLTAPPQQNTNIYRLRAPGVNQRSLLEMAKRLNLKGSLRGAEFLQDDKRLTYLEGPYVVTLCRRSGALRYYNITRWQMDDGQSHVKLSDDEAVGVARNFIQASDLAPLAECKLFKVTRLHVATGEQGADRGEERVIDVGVVFRRMVDKVPVDGPGGMVMVYIDHTGEVTGCDRIWREVQEVHSNVPFEKLRSPAYAEQELGRYWRPYQFEHIEVEDMRFGYFELGRGELQRYLQPTYVMPLKLISADKRIVMKSVHVTLAGPKPVGRIMPPLKPILEEPPRRD